MHAIFAAHIHAGIGQAGFYHLADLVGVHGRLGGLK
jgi:hypothetical protein